MIVTAVGAATVVAVGVDVATAAVTDVIFKAAVRAAAAAAAHAPRGRRPRECGPNAAQVQAQSFARTRTCAPASLAADFAIVLL